MSDFLKKEAITLSTNHIKIIIKDITCFDNGNLCCIKIVISQGENSDIREFVIFTSQKNDLHLSQGEISTEQFAIIEHATKVCEAAKRGAMILSYTRNSAYMLKQKLYRKGFDREIANEAVLYLDEKGYINESDDVEREAQNCVNKLWGKRKIVSHLYAKGYSGEAIRCADDFIQTVDFEETCLKLLKKKYKAPPETPYERDKIIACLMRCGYNSSDIKQALIRFSDYNK